MQTKKPYLFYGCIISLAMLVILFTVRLCKPVLLDIDIKWLGATLVPIIIALIAGKYISKFKGFGVEFEIATRKVIENPSIITFLHPIQAVSKQDIDHINRIPYEEKKVINVLKFTTHRRGYYDVDAIRFYLQELPNIEFFQIADRDGKFISLLKVDREIFINSYYERIERFIRNVERNDFRNSEMQASEQFVYTTDTVLKVYRLIKESGLNFIAVINPSEKKLVGIVYKRKIEEYLATAVLKNIEEQDQ